MRKLIASLLIAATALPVIATPAYAQSPGELRRDRRDIREERRDVRDAQRYGTRRDVRDERGDLRNARREYREDLRDRDRRWGNDDWRRYRQNNRALYSRGGWNAPFRYQHFRPGTRIRSVYYGPRYVISDPWRYRLPPIGGYQRWVRHYDDLLLIDVRRGTVLRVIPSFYW